MAELAVAAINLLGQVQGTRGHGPQDHEGGVGQVADDVDDHVLPSPLEAGLYRLLRVVDHVVESLDGHAGVGIGESRG